MKLRVVLTLLTGTLLLGCSTVAPATVEPSPNINTTVKAKVAKELVATPAETTLTPVSSESPTPTTIPAVTPVSSQIPSPTNLPTPDTTETPSLTAKQRLISIGFNVPRAVPFSEAEQEHVAGLDIPLEYQERYIEVQNNLNTVLGAYPNYIYIVYDPNGTEQDAEPIFERLKEVKFAGYKDGYTVSELIERSTCLGGANSGERRSASTTPYSICFDSLAKIYNYRYRAGPPNANSYGRLALHNAHEYFHHYQRAHALDRGLDLQDDRSNPTTTVQAPRWWIEGAAVTFQNAWYQANWQSLSFVNDSSAAFSITSVATSDDYKRVRSSIMGNISEQEKRADSCPSDWYMTSADNLSRTCEGANLATAFMAYKSSYKTVW